MWQKYLMTYGVAVLIFLVIDLVWLGLVAKNFYQKYLGGLMGEVNWYAAIGFYLLFIVGILIFALIPSLNAGDWQKALILGGLFGLMTYATYDLTNLATLKNWPLLVTVVDMIWGTVLSASVSVLSYFIVSRFW